ncbi:MAG TPA: L-serine ammonia-lyase [Thermoanaerobaculales bacterium]|nr:L-serine ammonia-lyase [Thermoanaerobaculales bacterium]HPA79482.1 L-serine ammonia-lyase [Thermoanaerobaculales bacterium]HQL29705.1 L-serine ammonia-lyase [Thermoanaerobaculales bacterium]HQN95439.1 L-serine ammonia-lyase [Thermoanaerobaculales bacterium]
MELSVFDLFKIGIGPSSSHTVGPMRAAKFLCRKLRKHGLFDRVGRVRVELYGSLASTGRGHRTDRAIVWGLLGEEPETIEPERQEPLWREVEASGRLLLDGERGIAFSPAADIVFKPDELLPFHPNGMRFLVSDEAGASLYTKDFYSIGGGFIVGQKTARADTLIKSPEPVPRPFRSADELLEIARRDGLTVAEVVLGNESARRPREEVEVGLDRIHAAMGACIDRGLEQDGVLPGSLAVRRRAKGLYDMLRTLNESALTDPLTILDWVSLYALAVNEENAAGGRVVTAPTNGAAGIVPAVLRYYERFIRGADRAGVHAFLLTAGAVGMLYKLNASISGAEVGCQGEVGVACSMAAAGLTEALGGSPERVEDAAEIAMEHNLGLTCDPVGGLVQIPCIERNAMAAVKAINASRIALRRTSRAYVSLDQVIATMRQTGADMGSKYKETSAGGLAANITEC